MRTTRAYAAKRAIISRLKERAAQPGTALSERQVVYAWPGQQAELVCIYGGGVTFDQPGEDDLVDGNRDRMPFETATVGIHIRVAASPIPEGGIEDTDELVEAIADEITRELLADPYLAGGRSVARISGGQGDYSPIDDQAVSRLALRISVESHVQ